MSSKNSLKYRQRKSVTELTSKWDGRMLDVGELEKVRCNEAVRSGGLDLSSSKAVNMKMAI